MLNLINMILTGMLLILAADNPFGNRVDLGKIESEDLTEISGIEAGVLNKDVFWVHNDSGNDDAVYAINKKGELVAVFELEDTELVDLEDISIGSGPVSGKSYIYLADIGDNESVRKIKYIYRFEEPKIEDIKVFLKGTISEIEKFSFEYPDGSRDAETLMIDEREENLIIISKREDNVNVYISAIPDEGDKALSFKKISTLPFGNEGYVNSGVTGGDMSGDGSEILVKTYGKVYYYKRNGTLTETFSNKPIEVDYIFEPQSEAICFGAENEGFYTSSEVSPLQITPNLYFYPRKTSGLDDGSLNLNQEKNGLGAFARTELYSFEGVRVEDTSLSALSSGMYFMKYTYKDSVDTKKILLIK